MSMIPRSPMVLMSSPGTVSVSVIVALRVWGSGLAADLQLAPAQVDPLGFELDIAIVRKAELAVDGQAAQRRRIDVEDDFHVAADRDGVAFARHLPAGPGGRIGPAHSS